MHAFYSRAERGARVWQVVVLINTRKNSLAIVLKPKLRPQWQPLHFD